MSRQRRDKPEAEPIRPDARAQFLPNPTRSGVHLIVEVLALFRGGVVVDADHRLFPLQLAYRAYVKAHHLDR